MTDVLFGVGLWVAASFVAVLMFMVGAGIGYRSGWEAGFVEGERAAGERPLRSQDAQRRRAS